MKNPQEICYNARPLSDALNGRIRAHLRFIRRCLNGRRPLHVEPIRSVLDIGCASGALLQELPEIPFRAGIDIAEEQVLRVRQKGLEAHVCNLEHERLPYDDESFEMVLAFDVVEHVFNTDHILNEINRVLKPGGVFIGSVPNIYQPMSLWMMLMDYTPMYAARYRGLHVRDFTIRLFRQALRAHGFTPRRCSGSFLFPFVEPTWSHVLADWFPRLGSIVEIAATRHNRVILEDGICSDMTDLNRWFAEQERKATEAKRNH